MADNKLVTIHSNLQNLLKSKANALPKGFNDTRFMQNAMAVLQDTKDIQKMDPLSVARTMLKGAFLGLDFFNKECYAIPYGNSLNFQTDYKGEIKLAKKYSIKPIDDVYAKLVRVGDSFLEGVRNGKQYVDFNPKPFNIGEIVGVFSVCLYKDGSMLIETMTLEEIDKVRTTYSKMPDGKAWKNSYGEMAKKTCLRRLCKFIEYEFDSFEIAEAYKESADVNLSVEAEYEPIEMPKAKDPDPRKTSPADEGPEESLGDADATPEQEKLL